MVLYTDVPSIVARFNGLEDGLDDAQIQRRIEAACRAIDRATHRLHGYGLDESATAREYEVSGRVLDEPGTSYLLVDDIGDSVGIAVELGDGTTWTTVTGVRPGPYNALLDGQPFTELHQLVPYYGQGARPWWGQPLARVTARWGWPEIPEDIREAAEILTQRLFKRKDSPYGVAGDSDFGAIRVAKEDPDVVMLIRPFERKDGV